ncbi:hypothetical protein ACEP28_32225 [Pseudomonas aeruginosa]
MKSSDMYDKISTNSRSYEQRLRSVEKELSQAHEHELRLQHSIAKALRNFASLQIEENPAGNAEIELMLKRRASAENELRQRLAGAEAAVSQSLDFARTITTNIEQLIEQVDQRLAVDTHYQDLFALSLSAKNNAEGARGKYEEIASECTEKLKAFETDRLYRYLRAAKYGTDGYTRGGLVRALDRWVAGLCNFMQNHQAETTLLAMQAANESEWSLLTASFDGYKEQLMQLITSARAEAGVPELVAKQEASESAANAAKARASSLQDELEAFANKSDSYYEAILKALTGQLAGKLPSELRALAAATPDSGDDVLVEQLEDLRQQLTSNQALATRLNRECVEAKDAYERARDLERQLNKPRFKSSDYRYSSGLDLDALLVGYMAGAMSNQQVVREVDSHRESVPSSGGYGGSFGGGSTWGGSNNDGGFGGFSTSSSDSGGSFSTSDSL